MHITAIGSILREKQNLLQHSRTNYIMDITNINDLDAFTSHQHKNTEKFRFALKLRLKNQSLEKKIIYLKKRYFGVV